MGHVIPSPIAGRATSCQKKDSRIAVSKMSLNLRKGGGQNLRNRHRDRCLSYQW